MIIRPSIAGGGLHRLMLAGIEAAADVLVPVPGIQASPLMFVILEMIMRSHHDGFTQMQGLHLMSLLTQPGPCSALAVAGARDAAAGAGAAAAGARAAAAGAGTRAAGAGASEAVAGAGTRAAVAGAGTRAAATAAPAIGGELVPAGAASRAASTGTTAAAGGAAAGARATSAMPGEALPEGTAMPWASLLPLLGALITSSKSVWLPNWGQETFSIVLSKQLQVSAQVLKLANVCIQHHKQLACGQAAAKAGAEKRSSSSCQGGQPLEPSTVQHVGALVWAAMYAAHRACLQLTGIEQLITSRMVVPGYWEQIAAAAAAPRGLAVSEVLAAFLKEPQSSEGEEEGGTKEETAAAAEGGGAAGGGVMGPEGSTGAGRKLSEERAPSMSDSAGAASREAAAAAAAPGTVPGCYSSPPPASGGSNSEDDLAERRYAVHPAAAATEALDSKHKAGGSGNEAEDVLLAPTLAVLGVLREFGTDGLCTLTDLMESAALLDLGPTVTAESSLACFSAVVASYAGCSITGVLKGVARSLKAVCTSGPQLFSNSYFRLAEELFTGSSAAYMQCGIARVLACDGVAFCCNNTACSNLQGFTELQLPVLHGGSSRGAGVCGDCRAACYCSKHCQQQAWPLHKLGCGRQGLQE